MSALASRRGFLRDLVGLPLIGGGLTIIGAPSAVALPLAAAPLRQYVGFLGREFGAAHDELLRREPALRADRSLVTLMAEFKGDYHMFHVFADPTSGAIVDAAPPSSRAALVLSAVGCGWQEGGR